MAAWAASSVPQSSPLCNPINPSALYKHPCALHLSLLYIYQYTPHMRQLSRPGPTPPC